MMIEKAKKCRVCVFGCVWGKSRKGEGGPAVLTSRWRRCSIIKVPQIHRSEMGVVRDERRWKVSCPIGCWWLLYEKWALKPSRGFSVTSLFSVSLHHSDPYSPPPPIPPFFSVFDFNSIYSILIVYLRTIKNKDNKDLPTVADRKQKKKEKRMESRTCRFTFHAFRGVYLFSYYFFFFKPYQQ